MMRAMILQATRSPLREVELPVPQPGLEQLLIRVHACGVCRTDLHVVDGDLTQAKMPIVPGHEIVGTVVEKGAARRTVCRGRSRGRSMAGINVRSLPVLSTWPGEPV